MTKEQIIEWITNYVTEENFGEKHLIALMHITGLFNDCAESEADIFAFADALYEKYAK